MAAAVVMTTMDLYLHSAFEETRLGCEQCLNFYGVFL